MLLHELFVRLARELRNLELPQGITPERLSVLSVIDRYGPISVTALADQERVQPASMSRMVSALVAHRLVQRRDDRADRRGVLVTTTTNGRRLYEQAWAQRARYFAEALGRLNDEELGAMRALAEQLGRFTLLRDGGTVE